jgi:2-oxo-hept-3-ene-1,7-dioate hydratase
MSRRQEEAARHLFDARRTRVPVPRVRGLSSSDGALIKHEHIRLLTDDQRRGIGGYKVSLATGAWGALTEDVVLSSPATLPRLSAIDPLLEGEVVFVVESALAATSTMEEIQRGCRLAAGVEIADSRWEGWHPSDRGRFVGLSGPEIEADNAVSGWLVVGEAQAVAEPLPLDELSIAMYSSERLVAEGALSEVMGHPAAAVQWLLHELGKDGASLNVGQVISSGCPWHELVTAPPAGGTWAVEVAGLAPVRLTMT